MNECNQPLFVNPQWDTSGQNQSAAICGRALAAAYDALKGVSGGIQVWGVGLSPRGNDRPAAATNSSTTPVTFLGALGKWFRAFAQKTGRTAPLMDGLDFHPYPVPQSLPFATGYGDQRSASVTNLPRIYQAFYAAFNGTPQRTIGKQKGGGLPVSLNETGVQTDTFGKSGYSGSEISANAAGGVLDQYATESYQASWYRQMLDLVACDPNVAVVNIFHLIDETQPVRLAERPLLRRRNAEAVGAGRARLDREDRRPLSGQGELVDGGRAHPGSDTRRRRRRPSQRPSQDQAGEEGEGKVGLTGEHLFGSITNRCSPRSSQSLSLHSSSGRSPRGRPAPTATRRSTACRPTTRSGRSRRPLQRRRSRRGVADPEGEPPLRRDDPTGGAPGLTLTLS